MNRLIAEVCQIGLRTNETQWCERLFVIKLVAAGTSYNHFPSSTVVDCFREHKADL